MRPAFRLILSALLTMGLMSPAVAAQNPNTFTAQEFLKGAAQVDQRPLAKESFVLRQALFQWAATTPDVSFSVDACSVQSPWLEAPQKKNLVGSLMLMQSLLASEADQIARPHLGGRDHQLVGLKSALRLYVALKTHAQTDPVAQNVWAASPSATDPLAEIILAAINQKGESALDAFVCDSTAQP